MEKSRKDYVVHETLICFIYSAILNVVFFVLVHHTSSVLSWWDPDQLVFDFFPDAALCGFFGAIFPALITRWRLAGGRMPRKDGGTVPGVWRLGILSIVIGVVAGIVLGGLAVGIVFAAKPVEIAFWPAFVLKAIYGGIVGAVVTPFALIPVLRASALS